jgi:hypothetical protein
MANLALGAPTLTLGGITAAAGLEATAETALTAKTGFTFLNNGLVLVHLVVGSAGTGSLQFVATQGSNPAAITVADSSSYWFGPFDPAVYSDMTGLVTATISVVTGNSVGVYYMAAGKTLASYNALHNPFETVSGATDS